MSVYFIYLQVSVSFNCWWHQPLLETVTVEQVNNNYAMVLITLSTRSLCDVSRLGHLQQSDIHSLALH